MMKKNFSIKSTADLNDLQEKLGNAFLQIFERPCRSVSISKYGALQLGFGEAMDHIIAGRYVKKRYQIELGTYSRSWSYISRGQSGSRDEEAVAAEMLGKYVVSMAVDSGLVVLTMSSGEIRIGADDETDDIFYLHVKGHPSAFFSPTGGWCLEQG